MMTPVLTDAVVIKQKIKPTIVVQTAEPISTGSAKYNRCCETNKLNCSKKEIVIIANDTIKVKYFTQICASL
jgi:hypothetical protein